jgi:hypothetical protein
LSSPSSSFCFSVFIHNGLAKKIQTTNLWLKLSSSVSLLHYLGNIMLRVPYTV